MILDFEILQDSDLVDVVWYEVGIMPLRYDCFLGNFVLSGAGADLSVDWGWIPIFDFALAMRMIGDGLRSGKSEVFAFTDSDVEIRFDLNDDLVSISAEYAPGVLTVPVSQFVQAAEDLLSRVRSEIETTHPGLRQNKQYREALGTYW